MLLISKNKMEEAIQVLDMPDDYFWEINPIFGHFFFSYEKPLDSKKGFRDILVLPYPGLNQVTVRDKTFHISSSVTYAQQKYIIMRANPNNSY